MATFGVFGLGKSGKATVDYLTARSDEVFAWDDNETSRVGIATTPLDSWDWTKIDSLILSPGIPFTHPKPHAIVELANKHGKRIICDVELLWEDNEDAKYIAITGTNGKSTTTALTGHILKTNNYDVAIGGNLGTPALTLGKHKYYVLELSSYQLDLIDKARFDVAVWINISPDHIDRHGDIHGYVKAKKNIFKNGYQVAVVGVDDEMSTKVATELKDVICISSNKKLGDYPALPGKHNQQNINAAFEAAKAVGIAEDKIIAAIKTFPGLEHRIESVATIANVKFVNDSKATNADSTQHALAAFQDIYWILGGVPKSGGIESLSEYFPRVKKAYLIGQAANEFAKTLDGKVKHENSETLENAVNSAFKDAKSGVVLLSPACASFDQFKNFEERGNMFKKYVADLKHGS